ncbi:MAG: polyprenyl diphosphate synthase [Thermoplasmata archaeon]|nr:polyprenyl diphosphate synthase [Thermoplasmata archaeon]
MDGNRRFAERIGLGAERGHEFGKNKLEMVLEWADQIGIEILTVYGFSTENFDREDSEVNVLMDLFERSFLSVAEDERVHSRKVRVKAIGAVERLPERVRKAIAVAEEATEGYDHFHLNIAIAYGGREELVKAIRHIAEEVERGNVEPKQIDQGLIDGYLYTRGIPDPDLVLRTSGEIRLSNFLLWQAAYSEFYFSDVYWPDFRKVDLLRAVRTYQKRKRRFGK